MALTLVVVQYGILLLHVSGNTPYCTGAGNWCTMYCANQCDDANPCTTDHVI